MSNISKSSLEGFLDGYKARNLAANKLTFNFHVEEIVRLLDKLIIQVENDDNKLASENLAKCKTTLSKNFEVDNSKDYYNNCVVFGDSFNTFIDVNKVKVDVVTELNRKIIYHYLNLAKKMEDDKRIEELARKIASKIKAQ